MICRYKFSLLRFALFSADSDRRFGYKFIQNVCTYSFRTIEKRDGNFVNIRPIRYWLLISLECVKRRRVTFPPPFKHRRFSLICARTFVFPSVSVRNIRETGTNYMRRGVTTYISGNLWESNLIEAKKWRKHST